MDVFMTGGTGFIGSYVAMELVRRGHHITNLARNPDKVPALRDMPGIEMVKGDITDRSLLEGLVEGQDACIHIALNYTGHTGWQILLSDTLPTVFLSDVAAQAGVKCFIYTSSIAAYHRLEMDGAQEAQDATTIVKASAKLHPFSLYGATKSASEMYLLAQSHCSTMRVNIICPGYTFGNPVVEGASTQWMTGFQQIAARAWHGEPMSAVIDDGSGFTRGTQFIWAGDLAKLYGHVLDSDVNRKTYFGVSKRFVSWQAVAEEAIKRCDSSSSIQVDDKSGSHRKIWWDPSDMKRDFGLEFDAWEPICEHLDYYMEQLQSG
jgi:UDP-glucose 4-epimerase